MLKAILETLEGLDETTTALYLLIEDDKSPFNGKYMLNVEPVDGVTLENTESLKTALSTERTNREAAEKAVKAFGDLKPTEVTARLKKLDSLEKLDPEKEADKLAEARVQSIQDQAEAQIKETKAASEAREQSLVETVRRLVCTDAAKGALAKHKGDVELLLPHVERQTRVREKDDGHFVVEVIDANATPRLKDVSNQMTIEDLVIEMSKSPIYGKAFEAETRGSGADNQDQGGGSQNSGDNPWKAGSINLTKQTQILQKDKTLADRLKREAQG